MIVEAVAGGPRLVAELAQITGMHRNTVRAHLTRLEQAGLIAGEAVSPTGKGRPAFRYRLRETISLSGAEQQLLIHALVALVARAHETGAPALAEAEGYRIGRQLATSVPYPTREQAVAQVTDILRQLSFEPLLSQRDGVAMIALRHCPFAVRQDDPQGGIICAFHLGLIRGVAEVADPPDVVDVRLMPHVAPDLCRAEVRFS
jgi:predicted ArsR family transcriptional regulator